MLCILKVPNLRFPGFEGEWEAKKLGEIARFSKGKGISKAEIEENGKTECIRYGELYTTYNEIIDTVISKTNTELNKLILSEENDIIIPASGETQIDIATASCLMKSGVALGGDLNIIKTPLNGIFLSYYLNSKKKIEIANLAQGISVVHLYSSQLSTLEINYPLLQEQSKIAGFLSLCETRIQQSSKIIEGLKSFKSATSKKIFSQELRFKDDNGEDFPEWEEKKLGEIAEKRIKKNIDNKIINVFTNSAVNGIVNQRDFFEKDIANQNNLKGYYVVENNDFVYNPRISSTAPVGPISRNHLGSGVMSPLYSVFRFKCGNINFIECVFNTNVWHKHMEDIANYGARADRMSFAIGDFYKMPIPFPSLPEQAKIANFLSSIDEKIGTEKKILEQYKIQKAYLLQNMFV